MEIRIAVASHQARGQNIIRKRAILAFMERMAIMLVMVIVVMVIVMIVVIIIIVVLTAM